jgi:hypothetical protein
LAYLTTFLITVLCEAAVGAWGFRRELRLASWLPLVLCVNSLTHPIVFFVIMGRGWTYLSSVTIAEAFAWLAEAGLYRWCLRETTLRRCLGVSALANLLSWQAGPLITYWLFVRR